MKTIGYSDISNLVHKTINGYFNNQPEILEGKKIKSQLSEEEYKIHKEKILNDFVMSKGEGLKYLLLSMIYNGFISQMKKYKIDSENQYAFVDSSSWRKEVVKDFYKMETKSTQEDKKYKGGRNSPYLELVHNSISMFQDLLKELGINVFKYSKEEQGKQIGLEADDLIALMIKLNNTKNIENIIFSNDADFFQLQQQQNVKQYNPILKKEINLSPSEALKELYMKEIIGDGSDNISSIYKFKLMQKEKEVKFPRLGEKTINTIFSFYDLNSKDFIEKIIKDISMKIYINQYDKDLFRSKIITSLKNETKSSLEDSNMLNIQNIEKDILNQEKDYLKKQKKSLINKIEKLEEEDILLSEKLTKVEKKLSELENFEIQTTLQEIIDKITKNYNHNNNIINFNNIPKDLEEDFFKTYKLSTPVSQLEAKEIFLKYKLNHLSRSIKITKEQGKEEDTKLKEVQNKDTIITTTAQKIYYKISGFLKEEIIDFLEKQIEKGNTYISTMDIEGENRSYILRVKSSNVEENSPEWKFKNKNIKILEAIKRASNNIILQEIKPQIKKKLNNNISY